jgi:PAS domain S-box-containing protein
MKRAAIFLFMFVFLAGLYLLSRTNYLFFHVVIESFSVFVSCGAFVLAVSHVRKKTSDVNDFYTFLGFVLGGVAVLDFIHMSCYRGMGVFADVSSNEATQFWILARVYQALGLLFGCLLASTKIRVRRSYFYVANGSVVTFGIASVLLWKFFPDCFIEGLGLTAFKIASEWSVVAILLGTLAWMKLKGSAFQIPRLGFFQACVGVMIASEVLFTLHTDVYGIANFLGHILKFASLAMVAKSVFETLFLSPFVEVNQKLAAANLSLSARVEAVETLHGRILELSPSVIYVMDFSSSRIVFASRSAGNVLGIAADQFGSSECQAFFDHVHEDDVSLWRGSEDKLMQSADGAIVEVEYRFRHAHGHWIWLRSREAVFARSSDGLPVSKIGIAEDVTELHRSRELLKTRQLWLENTTARLEVALKEAHEANQAKSQLLGNVSHELRTPLSAIIGYVSLLIEEFSAESREGCWLRTVQSSADHLLFLINELLLLSQADQRKLELQGECFSPQALLYECLNMVKPELKTSVGLEVRVGDQIPETLWGDSPRIKQVVLNLLSNAARFTEKGAVVVDLSCMKRDSRSIMMVVSVSDTGCGMSKSFLPKLFEPFSQEREHPLRPRPGAGLGMALAKRITEAMNGDIVVTSEVGKGSRFVATMQMLVS